MIDPKTAQKILLDATQVLGWEYWKISSSLGSVLADDVYAPVDMPMFDMSAMDGYAVRFHLNGDAVFTCIDTVQAGDTRLIELLPGQCVRIFTGAWVPASSDAVVMQEKAVQNGQLVVVEASELKKGNHIRYQGSQIREGERVLEAGQFIHPAALGFLAGMGVRFVNIYDPVRVAILTTGNELQTSEHDLEPGKIYESNRILLEAALNELNMRSMYARSVADDAAETRRVIADLLEKVDVLIITGGISVGEYDFVGPALAELGVKTLFYKVAQKPGKPLFVGKLNHKTVFALPGNPAAVLTCFYEYVRPCLLKMKGHKKVLLPVQFLPLLQPVENQSNRALFLKAKVANGQVQILDKQGSDMLHSFALANALAFIPAETSYAVGDLAEVHLLPLSTMSYGS
ncbi:MAG: molybdopterin molybdotransferase MoeA [Saprospiraceae bacterium]|nr:molybdopterin molybdotransferase MoeA [Saprospiraceae bacterium]